MVDKKVWVVFEEERSRRKWVDMPSEVVGTPLFEHATDYITELEDGSRVMVRKSDGFIFPNRSDMSYADKKEIEKLKKKAKIRNNILKRQRVLY